MADNTTLNTGTGGDVIATDDISGVKYQRVKIVLGADGVNGGDVSSSNAMPISDNGSSITVDGSVTVSGTVTANAGTGTLNVSVQNASIPVTDNAGSLTVDNNGTFAVQAAQSGTWNIGTLTSITNSVTVDTELPVAAALADGASNPTTPTIGAANLVYNGTTWDRLDSASAFDGNAASTYTSVMAVKQVAKRLNPSNLGTATNSAVTVDVSGTHTVTVSIATTTTGTFIIEGTGDNINWGNVECFDIFADLWVSGQSITPTAGKVYSILAGGLRQIRIRTNATLGATVSNLWVLDHTQEFIAGIDTGAAPHNFGYSLVHKDAEYTSAQTGTALWTPASGKKFVVTDLTISTGGTTAGIVTLWQGASADTTYSAGTDPAIFRGEFAPSATVRPGAVKSFNVPYISTTADHILRVTTSAAITVYIQVNGYEI
jgi:hypothetical protein